MAPEAAWRALYALLLIVRLGCALLGKAYIHPDEWFQNGEAIMGDLFDVPTYKTWEFQPGFPCRSMASLRLFGLPLAGLARMLRALDVAPSANLLFTAQRLNAFAWSLALDWSFARLVRDRARSAAYLPSLCLFASSHVLLTFCVRPFSNSTEAALLGLCLVCLRNLVQLVERPSAVTWRLNSSLLGLLVALGVFARFTIVALLLPSAAAFLWAAWRLSGREPLDLIPRARHFVSLISGTAISFLIASAAHVAFDTTYFRSRLSGTNYKLFPPVLTPLNAFLYNLRPSNLEEHGLHPRWLHALVNAPMILGASVWLLLLFVSGETFEMGGRHRSAANLDKLLLATVLAGIALLSVQPHQEPRFLVPLALPGLVIFARWLAAGGGRMKRLALYLFLAQSVLSTAFFGFAHQGGVIPALLSVNARISEHLSLLVPSAATLEKPSPSLPPISIHVWRLFMPPPHLVLPSTCKTSNADSLCQLRNHASVDPDELMLRLLRAKEERQVEKSASKSYLVLIAPTWALADLDAADSQELQWTSRTLFGPHLDMDHLGEAWAVREQTGLREALSVQVRELQL